MNELVRQLSLRGADFTFKPYDCSAMYVNLENGNKVIIKDDIEFYMDRSVKSKYQVELRKI